MTLNGKQPLMTLILTMDYAAAKKLGVDLEELSPRLQEAVQPFLETIHPNITIVDVAKSAAYSTSFIAGHKAPPQIEAIFQAYEKTNSTNEVMQRRIEEARILVEMARCYFQDNPLQIITPVETTKNILLGMKFQVTNINFVTNTVLFTLVE